MNIYHRFRQLLPEEPLLIGRVTALNPDGSTDVILVSGGRLRTLGQPVPTLDAPVFVRGHEIASQAPEMAAYEVEV